jgi:hypothetical protein
MVMRNSRDCTSLKQVLRSSSNLEALESETLIEAPHEMSTIVYLFASIKKLTQ